MKYFCHQRPDRSFFIRGHQLPLCSRCTGIVIGASAYILYSFLIPVEYNLNMVIVCILLQLPYIIDGTTQYFKIRQSNNILRLITGLLGGVGVVMLARICRLIVNIFTGL